MDISTPAYLVSVKPLPQSLFAFDCQFFFMRTSETFHEPPNRLHHLRPLDVLFSVSFGSLFVAQGRSLICKRASDSSPAQETLGQSASISNLLDALDNLDLDGINSGIKRLLALISDPASIKLSGSQYQ